MKKITELTARVFDASGLNDNQIANRLSDGLNTTLHRQNIRDYRSGKQNMSFEKLCQAAEKLDVEISFNVKKIEFIL